MSEASEPGASSAPKCRVVLLGASNLTRGISTVVETAQNIRGQPLEVLAAAGFGRSYGIESNVLGRTLPGILHCGLWEALAARSPGPIAVLITDIGNDLLYGVEPAQIAAWIETVINRLQQPGARIVLTLLPMESVARLSERRFHFFRRLLFPSCRLSFDEARQRARELHDRVETLGRQRGIQLAEQGGHWYGFDPIHIRQRHWGSAWGEILAAWNEGPCDSAPLARGSLRRWLHLRTRLPERRRLFGIEQYREQPTGHLRSGTTVSFY